MFQFSNLETPGYVGFANLPNQVHRKSVKKGFEFTLMVVGESGLGKSTLVNSLFLTDLYPERVIPDAIGLYAFLIYIYRSTSLGSIDTHSYSVSLLLFIAIIVWREVTTKTPVFKHYIMLPCSIYIILLTIICTIYNSI